MLFLLSMAREGDLFFFKEPFALLVEVLDGEDATSDSLVSIPIQFDGFKSGDLGEFNRIAVFCFVYLKLK